VPGRKADEQELSRRTAPPVATRGEAGSIAHLAVAVAMTAGGAGLRLAAAPGPARCRRVGRTGDRQATAARGEGQPAAGCSWTSQAAPGAGP